MKLTPADYLTAWCESHKIARPVREHKFYAPVRDWAFDFCWPLQGRLAPGVALEVEGGIFGRGPKCPTCGRRSVGAHTSVERLLGDMEKYTLASLLGWRIIRVTPEQVTDGTAAAWLSRAML